MSTNWMVWLVCNYAVAIFICLWERSWLYALYWLGAFIITGSVVLMKIKGQG